MLFSGFFMALKAFTDYLQLEKNYSLQTIKAYHKDISSFSEFCQSAYQQEDITHVNYSQIRSWIVHLTEQQLSNKSINRKISALKAYYKFLLKIKQITTTPLAKHKALKTPKKIEIPFSEKEMEMALQDIDFPDNFEGTRNKLIIELLYATGIRRNELVNIKTQDISLSDNTLKVLGKRNKERIIPLIHTLKNTIQAYLSYRNEIKTTASGNFFFLLKNGNKIYDTLVYRIINAYFSKVSVKVKKSPHILRHTFATHMLSKGADLNAVKELLGHASLASTQVYTHNSVSELKKIYKKTHPRSNDNFQK